MTKTTKTNTVAAVNRRLKAEGHEERLTRGNGYYYFRGGTTGSWMSTSVYVFRSDDLTVDEWMAEYRELASQAWM